MLILHEDLSFKELRERNLSYVHSTVFHGEKVEDTDNQFIPQHDWRFLVQHGPEITSNSESFK